MPNRMKTILIIRIIKFKNKEIGNESFLPPSKTIKIKSNSASKNCSHRLTPFHLNIVTISPMVIGMVNTIPIPPVSARVISRDQFIDIVSKCIRILSKLIP